MATVPPLTTTGQDIPDPARIPIRGLNVPLAPETNGPAFRPKTTMSTAEGSDYFRTGPQPTWMGKTLPSAVPRSDIQSADSPNSAWG